MQFPIHFFSKERRIIAMVSTKHQGEMKLSSRFGWKNREKFLRSLDPLTPGFKLFVPDVVHGNKVAVLNGQSNETFLRLLRGKDGIITQTPGHLIGVTYADCPPILAAGKTTEGVLTVAAIHAGYKGILKKILREAITHMEQLGVVRDNIRLDILPGICRNCYEFGPEAPEVFREYPEFIRSKDGTDKFLVDLQGMIKQQLTVEEGLREENVSISSACTYEDPELFSDRRDRKNPKEPVKAGLAVIGIRKY